MLVAWRGTAALAAQVAAALALNVVLGAVLIPRYGQNGAAVDTLLTELVALALVARAGARSLPGLLGAPQFRALWWVSVGCVALAGGFALGGGARFVGAAAAVASLLAAEPSLVERLPLLKLGVLGGIASLVVVSTWATATSYGLRVISDSPTFLALIRSLAARPLQPASPFLTGQSQGESHASPYTQAIGWVWLKISGNALDPVWLGHVLGLVGIGVMLLVLHAVFVFVRREAGSRAAWIAIPVLLLLFGPAHVIWAGDLTFNGFLYGAYFPQTLAVALLLYTLLLTDGDPCWERYVLGSILVAATLVVHPFTGTLLAVLVAVRGSVLAQQWSGCWQVGSLCLVGGFVPVALARVLAGRRPRRDGCDGADARDRLRARPARRPRGAAAPPAAARGPRPAVAARGAGRDRRRGAGGLGALPLHTVPARPAAPLEPPQPLLGRGPVALAVDVRRRRGRARRPRPVSRSAGSRSRCSGSRAASRSASWAPEGWRCRSGGAFCCSARCRSRSAPHSCSRSRRRDECGRS